VDGTEGRKSLELAHGMICSNFTREQVSLPRTYASVLEELRTAGRAK
jgi:hypothetical protein